MQLPVLAPAEVTTTPETRPPGAASAASTAGSGPTSQTGASASARAAAASCASAASRSAANRRNSGGGVTRSNPSLAHSSGSAPNAPAPAAPRGWPRVSPDRPHGPAPRAPRRLPRPAPEVIASPSNLRCSRSAALSPDSSTGFVGWVEQRGWARIQIEMKIWQILLSPSRRRPGPTSPPLGTFSSGDVVPAVIRSCRGRVGPGLRRGDRRWGNSSLGSNAKPTGVIHCNGTVHADSELLFLECCATWKWRPPPILPGAAEPPLRTGSGWRRCLRG